MRDEIVRSGQIIAATSEMHEIELWREGGTDGGGRVRCGQKKKHIREMITTERSITYRRIGGANDTHAVIIQLKSMDRNVIFKCQGIR
jgi:Zn ribbon nucleic-acid-binding protein